MAEKKKVWVYDTEEGYGISDLPLRGRTDPNFEVDEATFDRWDLAISEYMATQNEIAEAM